MTEVHVRFTGPPVTLTPEERAQVAAAIADSASHHRGGSYPYRSPAIDAGIARGLGLRGCQHVMPGSRPAPEPEWREVVCHGGVRVRIPV